MSDGKAAEILDLEELAQKASPQRFKERIAGIVHEQRQGVWSDEYKEVYAPEKAQGTENLRRLTDVVSQELILEIVSRIQAQKLFSEEEVELAARRFDYHATGVMEFDQLQLIKKQTEDEGEPFDVEAALSRVSLLDPSEGAFIPRLPGNNPLTLREAMDQGVTKLEFDDENPIGLFDPLSEDEPEYIDIGESPLASEYFPPEDAQMREEQKRLVGVGLLRFNETNLAEDFDKKAELSTPGDFIRETLYATNAKLLQEKIKRGLEAKLSPDQIAEQLQREYPEHEAGLKEMITDVQAGFATGDSIGSWGMYKKILGVYGNNKTSLATIAGLAAASAGAEIGGTYFVQQGIKEDNPYKLLLSAGLLSASVPLKVIQTYRSEKLIKEIYLGKEEFDGVFFNVIREVVARQPTITNISRASVITSPEELRMHVNRLQRVMASIPSEVIPSAVSTLVAAAHLSRTTPTGVEGLGIAFNTAYGTLLTARQARKEADLEGIRQKTGRKAEALKADLLGGGGEKMVSERDTLEYAEKIRTLTRKELLNQLKYGLARYSTRGSALALQSIMAILDVDIDLSTIVSEASAQGMAADALTNLTGSALRSYPQLKELVNLYNILTLGNEADGTEVPEAMNLRFTGVSRKDETGKDYFSIDNLKINQGSKYILRGRSGQGKSQLFSVIYEGGIDEGLITVDGIRYGEVNKQNYRDSIAMKPQQPNTIEGNLGVNLAGLQYEEDKDIAVEIFKKSELFKQLAKQHYPEIDIESLHEESLNDMAARLLSERKIGSSFASRKQSLLSAGQLQMLALMRIQFQIDSSRKHLAENNSSKIKMVLLDEPFKELSSELRDEAIDWVNRWLDDPDLTVIFADHDRMMLANEKTKASYSPIERDFIDRLARLDEITVESGKVLLRD